MHRTTIPAGLRRHIISAEQAAEAIRDGMRIAMSGYAMAGYPKATVEALVERKRNGAELTIDLITGANVPWLDDRLAGAGLLHGRMPMSASRTLADLINGGKVRFVEQQMGRMPRLLKSGRLGRIDLAVLEGIGFNAQGELIPSTSVGFSHHLAAAAEAIIIEINSAQPRELIGIHDIHIPLPAPHTRPIPLTRASERIGSTGIPIDFTRVAGIVETRVPERMERAGSVPTRENSRIVSLLLTLLEREYSSAAGGLPPIQIGFGALADAAAAGLRESPFQDLQFFCGGVSEPVMELLSAGRAAAISTGGMTMSARVEEILAAVPDLHKRFVIRNGDISNHAEVIGRLGIAALNSGLEIDIYGNVNSSHITGSQVVNGIGGGAGFAANAGLSVIMIPSTSRSGTISHVVPMVSHQDICEHDVDIVITEHGAADLRGLDDIGRAEAIITHCTAGPYREQLSAYLQAAKRTCGGHHPQIPEEAFGWYRRLRETGTMQQE